MAYESYVNASAPKCRNIAAALHRFSGLVSAFENHSTDLANYLEGDDCLDFIEVVEHIASTLREAEEEARGALEDLRKVGAIGSGVKLSDLDEPVFPSAAGEYGDPASVATAELCDRLTVISYRLMEVERTHGRAYAEAKGREVTPVATDAEYLERELLVIGQLVPLALAKADELRELVPAD